MITKIMLGFGLIGVLVSVGAAQAQQAISFPKSMLIQSTPEGNTVKNRGVLRVGQDGVRLEANNGATLYEADYPSIMKLIYERTKKPRYSAGLLLAWPLLFTKEKQHYLTFESRGSYAFIKMHKSQFRGAVAALEANSGRDVERLVE